MAPSNELTVPYEVREMSRGVNLRLFCFVLLIYTLSIGILSVIIPLYSYSLGADRLTVGLILSANAVAHTAASLLWGKASDRIGRKSTLGLGMLKFGYHSSIRICERSITARSHRFVTRIGGSSFLGSADGSHC